MSNNEKLTETRYPFHGFYRPFVAEMEEIEAERAREQAVRQQPQALPTTAELTNKAIVLNQSNAMAVPAVTDEETSKETIPARAAVTENGKLPVAVELPEAKPEFADGTPGKIEWVGDLIGDEFKQWGHELVAIHAMTFTGKTSFILGPLLDWCIETAYTVRPPMRILILCNRKSLERDIFDEFNIKREDLKIIEHSTDEIEWGCY